MTQINMKITDTSSEFNYYITKLIKLDQKIDTKDLVLMVQKEVGDRFSSAPGKREYGSITVLLNYYYDIKSN